LLLNCLEFLPASSLRLFDARDRRLDATGPAERF